MHDTNEEKKIIEATPFTRAEDAKTVRKWRLTPLPTLLSCGFILLTLVVLFIFNARAVRFDVTPQPSGFSIAEGFFTYQLGERYLMLPGEYVLEANHPGYQPLRETVNVGDDADQDYQFSLTPLPGILNVTTNTEARAKIFIDGVAVGETPMVIDAVEPGLREVSLVSDRYQPYTQEINIQGKRIAQTLSADLLPAWALLTVNSVPSDATVSLDAIALAQTPATVEAIQGKRLLRISKSGFKPKELVLDIVAGIDQSTAVINLDVADAQLAITSSPSGASITLGGRFRGQTPMTLTLVPAAAYLIKLTKAGYAQVQGTIALNADDELTFDRQLKPIMGTISLNLMPVDALLFVDGQRQSTPTTRLELNTSPHDIRIEKPGYVTYQTVVTPQPGLPQALNVALQTLEEARVAARPDTLTTSLGQTLKLVLPGEFEMGAGRREPGRRSNEIQKQIRLTRPYYIGEHEVTNAEYKKYKSQHDSGVLGRALLNEAERPVVNLSWEEAVRFCNWLSAQQDLTPAYEAIKGNWQAVTPVTTGYRLPTEAEWVWAARYAAGPAPTRFPWGDSMPPGSADANYADASAENMVTYTIKSYKDHYRGPSPVGTFSANGRGLFDMAGNVSEWIHDYYSLDMPKSILLDPTGPDAGQFHVIKGSNYTHGRFSELRWTFRDYGDKARTDVGFRLARYLE
ncbi:MAG: sulfatase activating formylglycine-generating enzyme [Candidatus Pseudothioglobus sp.]|jgi:formylglycine-generating enzyme required for sulfatase activity